MSINWVNRDFPSAVGAYRKSSDENVAYNCIAYAAGNITEWWSHLPGYKWPAYRSPAIWSLIDVFKALGYEERPANDTAFDIKYDKLALYAKGDLRKHAARQLESGKWTSKLGEDEDIEHDNPDCLCGTKYGNIFCVMRKLRG